MTSPEVIRGFRTGMIIDGSYKLGALLCAHPRRTHVFRAEPTSGGPPLAIAIFHAQAREDTPEYRVFEREARALAKLSHPGLVEVLDYGLHSGHPYLVTELVEGEGLPAVFEREKAIDVATSLRVIASLYPALEAAHAAGICHGDLRSESIVLTREGARISGLGFVRLSQALLPAASASEVNPSADLESLGVLAEQLLAAPYAPRSESPATPHAIAQALASPVSMAAFQSAERRPPADPRRIEPPPPARSTPPPPGISQQPTPMNGGLRASPAPAPHRLEIDDFDDEPSRADLLSPAHLRILAKLTGSRGTLAAARRRAESGISRSLNLAVTCAVSLLVLLALLRAA